MDFLGFLYAAGSFSGSLIGLPSNVRLTALSPSDVYLVKFAPQSPANANGTLGAVALTRAFNGGGAAGRYAATDLVVDLQGSVYLSGSYAGGTLNLVAGATALANTGTTETDGFVGRVLVVSIVVECRGDCGYVCVCWCLYTHMSGHDRRC